MVVGRPEHPGSCDGLTGRIRSGILVLDIWLAGRNTPPDPLVGEEN